MIVPYAMVDGAWTLRDSQMIALFEKFEEEGTIQQIFRDGGVSTPKEFIRYFQSNEVILYLIFIDDRVGAIVWLTDICGRTAHIHFNALKYTWGNKIKSAGKETLSILSSVWDCLIGMTPTDNPLAIRFIKQIGMKEVGVVPNSLYDDALNKSVDALLTYYTKEEHDGRRDY